MLDSSSCLFQMPVRLNLSIDGRVCVFRWKSQQFKSIERLWSIGEDSFKVLSRRSRTQSDYGLCSPGKTSQVQGHSQIAIVWKRDQGKNIVKSWSVGKDTFDTSPRKSRQEYNQTRTQIRNPGPKEHIQIAIHLKRDTGISSYQERDRGYVCWKLSIALYITCRRHSQIESYRQRVLAYLFTPSTHSNHQPVVQFISPFQQYNWPVASNLPIRNVNHAPQTRTYTLT